MTYAPENGELEGRILKFEIKGVKGITPLTPNIYFLFSIAVFTKSMKSGCGFSTVLWYSG